jgi:hypothetical protein
MNYEQISKMTYAELRALEIDLNRVKCERIGFCVGTPEEEETSRALQIEYHAELDKQRQAEWERKKASDGKTAAIKKAKENELMGLITKCQGCEDPIDIEGQYWCSRGNTFWCCDCDPDNS